MIVAGVKIRIKFGGDKKYVHSKYMKDPSKIHAKYNIFTKVWKSLNSPSAISSVKVKIKLKPRP